MAFSANTFSINRARRTGPAPTAFLAAWATLYIGVAPSGPLAAQAEISGYSEILVSEPSSEAPPKPVFERQPDGILIRMGEVTMKIPPDYFFSPPRQEGNGLDAVDFSVVVMLPELEPRTPANMAEFIKPGQDRLVLIGLYYKGYVESAAKAI